MEGFRTVFRNRTAPDDPRIEDLKKWCGVFAKKGMASQLENGTSAGSMSFRVGAGLIITASGLVRKSGLEKGSFVRVVSFDAENMVALAEGIREPPSDTPTHSLIYFMRPEINAILHGHGPLLMERARGLGPFFGTDEELKRVVFAGNFLMRKDGFFALGRTIEEAGLLALEKAEHFG